jgi:hypothetical protein
MTVFVVQAIKGGTFKGADRFGDLNIIFEVEHQVVISAIPTLRKLNEALENFSNDDFLLLSGDPILIGLATTVAANKNNGQIRFLIWSKIDKAHYEVKLDLNYTEEAAPKLTREKPLHLSRQIGPRLSHQNTPSLWDVFRRWVRRY